MSCRILFFSVLRDLTGCSEMVWPLPAAGCTAGDLLAALTEKFPELARWHDSLRIAINLEYSQLTEMIPDQAEVAIMPPVQGG